jgi:hypothetical protein
MFFEDPALLIGVPLLIVGVLGGLLMLGTFVSYWIKPS